MADVAALVVALSAQLTKFEKDMKDAVKIAEKHTKDIENTFTKLNTEINNQLSGIAAGFSSRIGGLGSVLGTLGPIGTTVAIGLGAAVLAMNNLIASANEFAEKQKRLKEAAETTGITINQFKVLGRAAASVGVDADQFEGAINKMNAAIEELQKTASGKLFDALRKFPEILNELSNAKDPAAAIDILSRALDGLGNQFEKSAFLRAVFGRGGFDVGRVLKQVFDAGGINEMEKAAAALGKTVDEQLVKRIVQLKIEIEKAKKEQADFLGKLGAEDVLKAERDYLNFWTEIIKLIGDANQKMNEGQSAGGALFRSVRNRIFGDTSGFSGITTGPTVEQAGITSPSERAAAAAAFPGGAPLPTSRPAAPPAGQTLEQRIRDINDLIAAVGGAARQSELYQQKELQLDKQLKEGVISKGTYQRAIEQLGIEQSAAAEAARERFGVATEQSILDAKTIAIQEAVSKGLITQTQATLALAVAQKEAKEQAEQLQIRLSLLPELARFGLDARNQFKQLDTLATATFSNFENSIADVATSTKTLSEAFKSMTDSIIRDLVRLAIRRSVTGPLANALAGAFGGTNLAGAQNEGWFAGLSTGSFIPQRQGGGSVSRGRGYIVGEHGAELFVPSSAGQIVPGQLTKGGGGGSVVEINNYVAADTESRQTQQTDPGGGERIIIDIVKKAQARGQFDDANRGRFALRPSKVR